MWKCVKEIEYFAYVKVVSDIKIDIHHEQYLTRSQLSFVLVINQFIIFQVNLSKFLVKFL